MRRVRTRVIRFMAYSIAYSIVCFTHAPYHMLISSIESTLHGSIPNTLHASKYASVGRITQVKQFKQCFLHGSFHDSLPNIIHGSLHGSLPSTLHDSLPNSLHGSLHGSLPNILHDSLHGSLPNSLHGSPHDSLLSILHSQQFV